MSDGTSNGTAKELRSLILETVRGVDHKVDKLYDKVDTLQGEVTTIKLDVNSVKVENKAKTAVFGLLGGLIPALGVLIYFLVSQ